LDNLTYAGNLKNLEPVASSNRFEFIQGDIRDESTVNSLVPNIDVLINFAAQSHVDRSISNPSDFIETNVVGTSTLVMAAVKSNIKKYIQVSTDEVYGSIESGSWSEDFQLLPNSPYAASKAAADLVVRGIGNTHNLNYNITRCSNNYGPYQFPEKIVPLFITNLIDKKSIPIYGDGNNVREWIHVDDHCAAINLVIEKGIPREIYNVGGGTEKTNLELTRQILDEFNVSENFIKFIEDRKNHDRRYSIDDSKIRNTLGFKPMRSFESGLKMTISWYRENENWWRPLRLEGQG
jgi:dTDP-glucose 4,6-dehydratase